MNANARWRSTRSSVSDRGALPSQIQQLLHQLAVDVRHLRDELDDRGDELNKPHRLDHLLEPRLDLVQIRAMRRSDPSVRLIDWRR